MKKVLNILVIGLVALGLSSCGSNNEGRNTTSVGGGSKELKIVHFDQTILGDSQKDLGVSIGIKKGNAELQTALNSALASLSTETRNTLMIEATDRSSDDTSSTASTPYVVPTDSSLPVLRVGLECDYAPFNWTETKANDYTYPIKGSSDFADGYDIQVARYLAYTMNYRLEIVKLDWDALIPALQTGTINAVIAGMTDTEDRRQSIDFSDEYYVSELVLIVKKDSKYASATSLNDFNGAKIVSQISTVTDDVIEDWVSAYGVRHLNALDTFATCAMAVQNNLADAMTAELPVANAIVKGSK